MRKLLNTLFVHAEDAYLSKSGETVVVKTENGNHAFPLHSLEAIICFSRKGASIELMAACAEKGINLAFCDPGWRFRVRVSSEMPGNVLLRREQYRIADDELRSMSIMKYMLFGKLQGCCRNLDRFRRDHTVRIDEQIFRNVSGQISDIANQMLVSDSEVNLRGLEASAATLYFGLFDDMVLGDHTVFYFHKRNRRPPLDAMNAVMSYVYMMTEHLCESALEAYGLDSKVGFLHKDRAGKPSLALDMMEEMRPYLADRFTFKLINNRMLSAKHFEHQDSGAVMITKDGRHIISKAWHDYLYEEVTLSFPKNQKVNRGLVPYVQSQILAACIRGDRPDYVPFLWR